LLRSGKLADADIPNIAQEIQDMAISQRRELMSRLSVLLRHLLNYEFSGRGGRPLLPEAGRQPSGSSDVNSPDCSIRCPVCDIF